MTDITSAANKIQVEEADANSANSEGFNSKAGGSINYLLDEVTGGRVGRKYDLLTPGTYTWTCPDSVTSINITCIGGGGGSHISAWGIGAGGGGMISGIVKVTPGVEYTFTVGGGGNSSPGEAPGDLSEMLNICRATGGAETNNGQGGKGEIISSTLFHSLAGSRGGNGGEAAGEAGGDTAIATGGGAGGSKASGGAGWGGDGGFGGGTGAGGGYVSIAAGFTGGDGAVFISHDINAYDTTDNSPV